MLLNYDLIVILSSLGIDLLLNAVNCQLISNNDLEDDSRLQSVAIVNKNNFTFIYSNYSLI